MKTQRTLFHRLLSTVVPQVKRILFKGYVLGVLSSVATLYVLHSLKDVFGGSPPLLLFLLAITLAVWRGEFMAGILTTVLSTLLSVRFLVEPYNSFTVVADASERLRVVLLLATGALLSLAIALSRKTERRALCALMEREEQLENVRQELERRVADRTAEVRSALQSMMQQSRYLEAFFQHAITPLVFLDRNFNFIRVNQAYAKACQREEDEFPGHNHFEFYPSDARSIFEEVVRNRQTFEAVARPFMFPDHPEWGVTYWDWTLTPVLDERGEVEVLVFALQDVTLRKRAEIELEQYRHHLEELVQQQTYELEAANAQLQADIAERERVEQARLKAEAALRESETLYRSVVTAMVEGVVYQDASGVITAVNPAAERIEELAAEEIIGRSSDDPCWQAVHEDGSPFPGEHHPSMVSLRTGEPQSDVVMGIRRRDGTLAWISINSRPLMFAGESKPHAVVTTFHDITERKRTEEALKQADQRKNEFLAMLGHELRNPLAPIRNAVQVLRMLNIAEPTLEWSRDVIERQVGHMARLLDDLLDLARIKQGKVRLQRERFELSEAVDNAVETCRPLIDERQQALTVLRSAEPQWIEGDRVRLAQVVSNLLNNAAKYTEKGGKISLSVASESTEAVIRIRDNGIGIAAEILPHVFDLFTQADRSLAHAQGGLGIGLTLVRNLVEMHGGTVAAASAGIGQGSEFTVRLPRLPLPLPRPESPPAESAPPADKLRILVVDDFADAAESLALLLGVLGNEVETADCGAKAIERALEFLPQVVLLDIGLPDLDGYEVARRLRALPQTRQAKLIALTGYGQPEDCERSHAAGFDRHLLKPVDPEMLSALLADLAARRHAEPELSAGAPAGVIAHDA